MVSLLWWAEGVMFGEFPFSDKVIMVAGAAHPLGQTLCHRLAMTEATVIAVDGAEPALFDLARRHPGQIEPLQVAQTRRDLLALLKEAWGAHPLDGYVDLWPLSATSDAGKTAEVFGRSVALANAMVEGICAGGGVGLFTLGDDARTTPYLSLYKQFSRKCLPGRAAAVRVPTGTEWSADTLASASDLLLAALHPVTRGMKNGSVLDWDAQAH